VLDVCTLITYQKTNDNDFIVSENFLDEAVLTVGAGELALA